MPSACRRVTEMVIWRGGGGRSGPVRARLPDRDERPHSAARGTAGGFFIRPDLAQRKPVMINALCVILMV